MEPKYNVNELLARCEKELDQANADLSALMDIDVVEDQQEFTAQVDYLMEKINKLSLEFQSLLRSL